MMNRLWSQLKPAALREMTELVDGINHQADGVVANIRGNGVILDTVKVKSKPQGLVQGNRKLY